jgi:RNA polymerase sigma-70 factor (ECF subfamily)
MTWSAQAFDELVDPHRRELFVHCYRMLGSADDAEDAVQDTMVRAWRGRSTFRRSISFRAWLYRIATNVCLDTIAHRRRSPGSAPGIAVEPIPDPLLAHAEPDESGPEARYDARESVSLAFLTVLQVLPPRQRAILLLRDVLALRATEVAALLDVSVPAANSSLQRARAAIRGRYGRPDESSEVPTPSAPQVRTLLERYVQAWEAADIVGLVGLLRDDALLAMPPMPSVSGAERIGAFLARVIFRDHPRSRLIRTAPANGSPAFVAYGSSATDATLRAFALLVLGAHGDGISRIDAFADPRLLARFEAPTVLAG